MKLKVQNKIKQKKIRQNCVKRSVKLYEYYCKIKDSIFIKF